MHLVLRYFMAPVLPASNCADTVAIKRFAWDNYNTAKYYDFDRGYLIEMEVHVRHFEVYTEASLDQEGGE